MDFCGTFKKCKAKFTTEFAADLRTDFKDLRSEICLVHFKLELRKQNTKFCRKGAG